MQINLFIQDLFVISLPDITSLNFFQQIKFRFQIYVIVRKKFEIKRTFIFLFFHNQESSCQNDVEEKQKSKNLIIALVNFQKQTYFHYFKIKKQVLYLNNQQQSKLFISINEKIFNNVLIFLYILCFQVNKLKHFTVKEQFYDYIPQKQSLNIIVLVQQKYIYPFKIINQIPKKYYILILNIQIYLLFIYLLIHTYIHKYIHFDLLFLLLKLLKLN
ncbi:transmembrane protein, putative (macronuclear) [Tetrahymena thermophila SB210]|uniref:Transmembrane protein, putative n=1 Tax=Tetrahymena thermophila (strain SB210) TaxID=312017 RepID=W7XH12_TETTS|nr:transmembrane protein, putative [Tetrahymena thermophila SB210]EWS76393.1 transmembrane protein, putative [Tetrahymena thermophila SB210]|eukprot:XP_012651177.1 transmembrane protein, putative [Tetrahymena thermophila SB210]